VSGFENLLKK